MIMKLKEEGIVADVQELLAFAQMQHNWMPTSSDGFSPAQRLTGRNLNIPGLDLEKTNLPVLLGIAEDRDPASRIIKAQSLMLKVREEFASNDNAKELARAISHRVRTDKRQALHLGDWVYVWRQDKNHIKGKYVGPARVVGGHSRLVLIELSGKVYRTSAQFIIHVSNVKSDIGAAEGDTLGQPSSGDVGFPITENMMLSPDVAMPPALNAEEADLA